MTISNHSVSIAKSESEKSIATLISTLKKLNIEAHLLIHYFRCTEDPGFDNTFIAKQSVVAYPYIMRVMPIVNYNAVYLTVDFPFSCVKKSGPGAARTSFFAFENKKSPIQSKASL